MAVTEALSTVAAAALSGLAVHAAHAHATHFLRPGLAPARELPLLLHGGLRDAQRPPAGADRVSRRPPPLRRGPPAPSAPSPSWRPQEGQRGRTVPRDCGGGRRRHGPGLSILGLCRGPKGPHPIPQKPSQPSPFPLHPENHQCLANLLPPHWLKAGEPKRRDAATTGLDLPGPVPEGRRLQVGMGAGGHVATASKYPDT